MKRNPLLVLFALFGCCLATVQIRASQFTMFQRVWGDCVVVTDVSEEGRALTPPSRERPVYFLGRSFGCRLGTMAGEHSPDDKEMRLFVARVLARQGYLGAQPGVHEPELYLVLQWGRVNARSGELLWFLGYDPRLDPAAPAFPGKVGPEVHRRNFRPREIETVLEYASEDIYGIIVSAFDYQSIQTPEPVLLWQTRIALPANGKSMTEALPVMAKIAGPQIGRETTKPLLRGTDDRFTTEIGELEMVGFEEAPSKGSRRE